MSRENSNRIRAVFTSLGELGSEVVFVGGATVALYADRPAGEVRPTDDVDVLVELLHYSNYSELEERLRSKGFINETESGVICRYQIQGIIVDIMPTEEKVLGFSNKWYKDGFSQSVYVELDSAIQVRIFTAPYFLASKLEAFKNRGGKDGRSSTDFEDIVYLLNNREVIWQEIRESEEKVQQYIKETFKALLEIGYLEEWVSCHLDYNEQRRLIRIMGELESLCGKSNPR